MTREELLSHAHAGRTLRQTWPLLGLTQHQLENLCTRHAINWRVERMKNPHVKAANTALMRRNRQRQTELSKCRECPK